MLLSLACQDLTNFGKVQLGLQLTVCPAQHDMAYHSTACATYSYLCPAQQAPPQCTLPPIHTSSSSSMPLLPCQGQEIMLPSLPTFLLQPNTPDGQQLLLLLLLAALMVYMSCPGLYHMLQCCKIPASQKEVFVSCHILMEACGCNQAHPGGSCKKHLALCMCPADVHVTLLANTWPNLQHLTKGLMHLTTSVCLCIVIGFCYDQCGH